MAIQELENKIKQVKKLTSKDHPHVGGFNRSTLWCASTEFKQNPVKDDMLFSSCHLVVKRIHK